MMKIQHKTLSVINCVSTCLPSRIQVMKFHYMVSADVTSVAIIVRSSGERKRRWELLTFLVITWCEKITHACIADLRVMLPCAIRGLIIPGIVPRQDVTPCQLVNSHQSFKGFLCAHHHGKVFFEESFRPA